jgi:hypothetical protein
MADYIEPPLQAEPGVKYEEMVAELQTRWPDWTPADANLEVQILLAVANLSASDEQTASGALTSIFRWFGQNLVPEGQPEEAVAASGTITVTLNENPSGVTIPAGTTYGVDVGEEALLGFEVVLDQNIAPGVLTATGIPVIAGSEGAIGNDLTGALVQVDTLGFVASVVFDTPTSGGVDAEEDDVYLDRLRSLLQLQAPRPIIPNDFSIMARSVPGVERATTIDGYDPNDHATYNASVPSTWKERVVAVSVIDADGEDPGTTIRTAVDVLFNGSAVLGIPARREVNFVVSVVAPTYTPIDVAFTALAWPTWNPSDVEAAAEAAVTEYLQPYLWGQTGGSDARGWENAPQVTIDGLYAVLSGVEGLRNVTSLTFGESGYTDDFSVNTIGSGAWLFDTGSGTLAVSGGQLVPSSTAAKELYRTQLFENGRLSFKFVTGASVAGSPMWSVRLKRLDATNDIRIRVTPSAMTIRKLDANVDTQLATTAVTVGTAATRWVKGYIVGNLITAELWTTDPALGGSPATSLTYTLAGADATKFGTGIFGALGFRVVPAGTDERYDSVVAGGLQGGSPVTLIGAPGPVLTRPGVINGTVT